MKPLKIANFVIFPLAIITAIGSQSTPTVKTIKHEGKFQTTTIAPSTICTNFGIPTVSISFTVISSHHQNVDLYLNNIRVSGLGWGFNIQDFDGSGTWRGTASVGLQQVFGNNIPPNVTIRGELWDQQAGPGGPFQVASAVKMDEFSTTIHPAPCEPPGLKR